jgi:hypothetical protein
MHEEILKRWWTKLLAYARTKTDLHSKNAPTDGPWVRAATGVSGVGFCYSVKQHESYVELRIDRKSTDQNKDIFDRLVVDEQEIEVTVGRRLDWKRLDELQHSRIGAIVPGGYADSERQWSVIHEHMVDAMIRLKEALDPHLADLKAAVTDS